MNIKAIETVYNGYRFRSRLEARWAVFFDVLDIKYEYEPEGFDIGETWYLPDFYLPDHDAWLEIKSKHVQDVKNDGQHTDEYIKAIVKLACFAIDKGEPMVARTALLIFGQPYPGSYEIIGSRKDDAVEDTIGGYFFVGRKNDRELWVGRNGETVSCLKILCPEDDRYPMSECERLTKAYLSARQARFEHGETPRVSR